jgi:hypothetical protein
VTVPAGGWKVDAIAIYTSPSQPADWRKVGRARLNVIAKKGICRRGGRTRKGREVEVTVREAQKGVYEVRAAELKLTLEPGEYWIGLTPIHSQTNGFAEHLIAFGVRDARFDDVHRAADEDLSPEERAWAALSPNSSRRTPVDSHRGPAYPPRSDSRLARRINPWMQNKCTCGMAPSTRWRIPQRFRRN